MKYIKTFENSNNRLDLGDYVICKEIPDMFDKEKLYNVIKFEENRVGRYIKNKKNNGKFRYEVTYDDIPDKFKNFYFIIDHELHLYTRPMSRTEIIYNSKNKEELEAIIAAKKFNI